MIKQINGYKYKMHGALLNFDIQTGDQIYILCTYPIVFEHHGIYVGNGNVVHFSGSNGVVQEDTLEVFGMNCTHVVRKAPDTYFIGDWFTSEVK